MRLVHLLCSAALVCASVLSAQSAKPLTDAEVEAAIAKGQFGRGLDYVSLQDQMGGCNTCPTSGFSIGISNPAQYVAFLARTAKQKLEPSTVTDVTPEMRAPVLHVDA